MKISIKQLGADSALFIVTLIWGTTFVLVKDSVESVAPLTFLCLRFGVAAVALGLLFPRLWKRLNRSTVICGIVLGIVLFAGFALQTFGIQATTASKAGFITGLNVVLVPFGSALILKVKPSKASVIGVVLATLGLAMVSMKGLELPSRGDVLVILCAAGFALHIVLTNKYSAGADSVALSAVQMLTACLLSGVSALAVNGPSSFYFTEPNLWFSVLYLGVMATAGAFTVQTFVQNYTTAVRTALIFALEPVFAALFAWHFNGEMISPIQTIGCTAMLAGVIVSEIGGDQLRGKDLDQAAAVGSRISA